MSVFWAGFCLSVQKQRLLSDAELLSRAPRGPVMSQLGALHRPSGTKGLVTIWGVIWGNRVENDAKQFSARKDAQA